MKGAHESFRFAPSIRTTVITEGRGTKEALISFQQYHWPLTQVEPRCGSLLCGVVMMMRERNQPYIDVVRVGSS